MQYIETSCKSTYLELRWCMKTHNSVCTLHKCTNNITIPIPKFGPRSMKDTQFKQQDNFIQTHLNIKEKKKNQEKEKKRESYKIIMNLPQPTSWSRFRG